MNENILLDLNIKGQMRKVLAHPDRNARMYIMDRGTGEVLSAEPFAFLNTSEGVDLKTGQLSTVPSKSTGFKTVRDICPARSGRQGLAALRLFAEDGLLYIPHNNLCMEIQGTPGELHRRNALCGREGTDVRRTGG